MPTLKTCFLIVSLFLVTGSSLATKGKGRRSISNSSKATKGKGHGHWSLWSPWSTCDVTCGNGSQIRHRSCTYPAGMNDCPGSDTEMKPCYLLLCPVHGGWSTWENWSTCSATCGIGMRIRTRSCTNPSPERFGDHCFGDSHEVELCNTGSCKINGGWSTWGNWGTCSATCGVGMRSRTRSCTNPPPENCGDHCFGDVHEVELCNIGSCTTKVAFNAYTTNSTGYYPEGTVLIFPVVTLNEGQGYDTSSGIFTAPVTGVYEFTVHFCHPINEHMIVSINNGATQLAISTVFETHKSDCTSVSTISRIEESETVYVKARWSASFLQSDPYLWPSFNGYLLYQVD